MGCNHAVAGTRAVSRGVAVVDGRDMGCINTRDSVSAWSSAWPGVRRPRPRDGNNDDSVSRASSSQPSCHSAMKLRRSHYRDVFLSWWLAPWSRGHPKNISSVPDATLTINWKTKDRWKSTFWLCIEIQKYSINSRFGLLIRSRGVLSTTKTLVTLEGLIWSKFILIVHKLETQFFFHLTCSCSYLEALPKTWQTSASVTWNITLHL